jgi:hypothetical protein
VNEKSEKPIHLAGVKMGRHRHVCALFENQKQGDKVIIPFLKEGIERGERVCCISGVEIRTHLLQKLQLAGIEVAMAEKGGQLKFDQWGPSMVRSGHFDQEAVVSRIEDMLKGGREQGFELTRFVGYMEWARDNNVDIDDLVEFETHVTRMLEEFNDPVICAYNLSAFNAGALVNILRTHPVAILGDVVAENPFFDPPEVVLRELRGGGAGANDRMEG